MITRLSGNLRFCQREKSLFFCSALGFGPSQSDLINEKIPSAASSRLLTNKTRPKRAAQTAVYNFISQFTAETAGLGRKQHRSSRQLVARTAEKFHFIFYAAGEIDFLLTVNEVESLRPRHS
jgi:hypothetical protein